MVIGANINTLMDLKDKTVLLTGGSLGIGKAIAKLLVEKGAKVAITGRNADRLNKAAAEIGAFAIQADVALEADVFRTYETFLAEFGHLDVLINNAGVGTSWDEVDALKLEDFQKVFNINVFGAAMMGREAAKLFKAQNHGDILNIGSTASAKGFARGSVYSSSKFALRGMTQCWAAELRKFNIRVTLVMPSEVPTAFGTADGVERELVANKLSPLEIAHPIVAALEMDGRGFIPEFAVWATNPW